MGVCGGDARLGESMARLPRKEQIAGLIARRIVSFAREGDSIGTGERFGLIRFGSRVDVYMPDNAVPLVGLGSKAIAGETILADLSSTEARRSYKVG